MSTDIALTAALKNTLLSLQDTRTNARQSGVSSGTVDGVKPSSLGGAGNAASGGVAPNQETLIDIQNLNNRAGGLQAVLDGIGQSIQTLESAEKGARGIEAVLLEAESLIQGNIDAGQVEQEFPERYTSILAWIESTAEKAGYRGINLLTGDSLVTSFNQGGQGDLVTEGENFTVYGLGLDQSDPQSFEGQGNLLSSIRVAINDVRTFINDIGDDLSQIQARRDFTEQTLSTLSTGVDNLSLSDQDEEGAGLLALQTRQALSQSDFSLASPAQQDVIRLF